MHIHLIKRIIFNHIDVIIMKLFTKVTNFVCFSLVQVPISIPIIFFIICSFLVTLPIYVSPMEVGVGTAVIISGIPVYFLFIDWKNKPLWLINSSSKCLLKPSITHSSLTVRDMDLFIDKIYLLTDAFNRSCAKLFLCVEEDKSD